MKTVSEHGTFTETLSGSGSEARALARTLRDLIARVYPDAVEVPWPKQKITGYGVGPKKMSEHFCYIGAFKTHVNLGFYYGAALPDPEGLLEGTGKAFRHVKVRSADDLGRPALRTLIEAAARERLTALGRDGA